MIRDQNGTFFLSLSALLQTSAKRPANCKQIGKAAGTGRAGLLGKQSGLHPPLIFLNYRAPRPVFGRLEMVCSR